MFLVFLWAASKVLCFVPQQLRYIGQRSFAARHVPRQCQQRRSYLTAPLCFAALSTLSWFMQLAGSAAVRRLMHLRSTCPTAQGPGFACIAQLRRLFHPVRRTEVAAGRAVRLCGACVGRCCAGTYPITARSKAYAAHAHSRLPRCAVPSPATGSRPCPSCGRTAWHHVDHSATTIS